MNTLTKLHCSTLSDNFMSLHVKILRSYSLWTTLIRLHHKCLYVCLLCKCSFQSNPGSDLNCDPRGAVVLLCGPRWCKLPTKQLFLFVQKDAHTLYLEQELESLRAVLEIKTNQIHQQDKKLMQMDKLVRFTHTVYNSQIYWHPCSSLHQGAKIIHG